MMAVAVRVFVQVLSHRNGTIATANCSGMWNCGMAASVCATQLIKLRALLLRQLAVGILGFNFTNSHDGSHTYVWMYSAHIHM